MKGQFTWDYIVSIAAFITLVSYLSLQIINSTPAAMNSLRTEFLRSEAYQISDLLINDPGEPKSWTTSNVLRLGLSNENYNFTNYLSSAKISNFTAICANSGYVAVANLLGVNINKYNISVILINESSPTPSTITICSPPLIITRSVNVTMERFAAMDNGNYVGLILQAW